MKLLACFAQLIRFHKVAKTGVSLPVQLLDVSRSASRSSGISLDDWSDITVN